MPFTPTHIIATIPLAKIFRKIPFSALAIGSVVPDIPLFFPISTYTQTHSLLGLFTACVPMGMVVFVMFQSLFKIPLMTLLPVRVQRCLAVYARSELYRSIPLCLFIVLGLILGASTHLIWDAFTHQGRWGTQIAPFLNAEIGIADWSVPGYKIVQYGSTLIGLPWLLLISAKTVCNTPPESVDHFPQLTPRLKSVIVSSLILIPSAIAFTTLYADAPLAQKVGLAITNSGAMLIIAILIYSLALKLYCRWNRA